MLQAQHSLNNFLGMDLTEANYSENNFPMQAETEPSYCLCGQPYNPDIFMIQCDACKDWFHSSCCNFNEWQAIEIDKYHCPRCTPLAGPSIFKPIRNCHRHDFWDGNASTKPVQTGTPMFIQELCSRHFRPAEEIVVKVKGTELTENYLQTKGFNNPILIDDKDGLELMMPMDSFSLYDVQKLVGGHREIDVIDVCRQNNIRMQLQEFVEYFHNYNRTRIFNVVSLEFSNTGMSHMIEPPLIARKLDWVNVVWPPTIEGKPQVQKYCLMSTKDSYTDFHIDFGGTSVWYHVLRGEKVFFFVKPTTANLTLYSQWMTSTNQSETFFGDQVDQCFKCHVRQGQTMMIPTGWIHAVYTPVDSLVFGGNFLHSHNISMQLSCYEIEKKTKTEKKFLYPNFVAINFYAANNLLSQLIEINTQERQCPEILLTGLKALLQSLKHWNNEKDYNMSVREQLPYDINIPKLLKDIGKEIRHAERYINQLNPPKPERESKRKRKKPINKDFVDYSTLSPKTSSTNLVPMQETPPSPLDKKTPAQQVSPLKLTLPKPTTFPYARSSSVPAAVPFTESDTALPSTAATDQIWGLPFERPQETVAEYKGGTIMRFKLGAKDMLPTSSTEEVTYRDISYPENCDNPQDIYDFHDDSDRDEDCYNFTIDETPQKKPRGGIKMRLPVDKTKPKKHKSPKIKGNANTNTNGIESLLKASLTVPDRPQGETSPSTSEAIAGMLSISQNWTPSKSKKYPQFPEEDVKNVHQDEDYIYPSLDNSDEEEVHIFKPRGRTKVDEAWNPKARVGPLLPKMNRPAREGTKKQSVEKVLEAAAAARRKPEPSSEKSITPTQKRQYRRKKVKPKIVVRTPSTSSAPAQGDATPSTSAAGSTATGGAGTSSSHGPSSTTPKPRKGMKTVKQRLGKILKIHKMIH